MKSLQTHILIVFCLIGCSHLLRAQQFPAGFTGHWQGELEWYQAGKKEPQKVQMQLIIAPTDTLNVFTWQLLYGEKNEDSRPYILRLLDSAKSHWVIDECNGILLDHYWIGNRFSGAFTVQKSTIINNFRIEDDQMIIEFYGISAMPENSSGGNREEIPKVDSYAVKTFQKALLRKRKPGG